MNIRTDMKPIFSDKILASGDVYLDEKIVIHNVKVIQADKDGKTYSFVSFPEKLKGDEWEPVVMIKDKDLRKAITDTVNKSVVAQMKVEKEPLDLTVDVRLYEKDEFYVLSEGERVNRIDEENYKDIITEMKEELLLWYMKTCDIVPESYDDRFTDEFLENNIASVGIPLFVGKLATGIISLTGKTTSQFIDMVRRKFKL